MKVVINQSNYLPWKGYFDLIHDADLFVFLDDVQYTKNDWRNRNRIKSSNGLQWLTIPIGEPTSMLINQVSLPAGRWREKHWKSIAQSYANTRWFARYAPWFEEVYTRREFATLSALNQYLIKTIACNFLGITTEFRDSARFRLTSRKQDRVLDLLKIVGATTYISGPAARDYLDPERFEHEGIRLVWKDYSGYPEYPQFHPPFEHAVSIVDLLFHTGPAAPDYIWGRRRAATPAP